MIAKKKKVELTDESFQDLLQETYLDINAEQQRALVAYKKVTKQMDENTDIAMVGKVANDLLKIVDNAISNKLTLLKLQSNILHKNAKGADAGESGTGGTHKITDEDRAMIRQMLESGDDNIKKYQ